MNFKKVAKLPLLLTIISFILLLLAFLYVTYSEVDLSNVLPFLIPVVIFGLLTVIESIKKSTENIITIIIFILTPIFIFISIIAVVRISFESEATTKTKPHHYRYAVKSNSETMGYFPNKIPKDAQDIHFEYTSGFIGTHLLLGYVDDSEQIQKYNDELTEKAEWKGTHKEAISEKLQLSIPLYYKNKYGDELPDDFQIYVLHYRPYSENSWNHGTLGYVAVSILRNEVIFLYDKC